LPLPCPRLAACILKMARWNQTELENQPLAQLFKVRQAASPGHCPGYTSHLCDRGSLNPGGIRAISRWLSVATPPVTVRKRNCIPEGCQRRGVAAIPPGWCVLRFQTGGDARSPAPEFRCRGTRCQASSRNHRLMARKPPACLRQ